MTRKHGQFDAIELGNFLVSIPWDTDDCPAELWRRFNSGKASLSPSSKHTPLRAIWDQRNRGVAERRRCRGQSGVVVPVMAYALMGRLPCRIIRGSTDVVWAGRGVAASALVEQPGRKHAGAYPVSGIPGRKEFNMRTLTRRVPYMRYWPITRSPSAQTMRTAIAEPSIARIRPV